MAEKEEFLEFEGTVTELLPEGRYRVKLDNEHMVLAYTAGKMRRNKIKTLVGDRVTVEMTPYDLSKGRITFRHKTEGAEITESGLVQQDGAFFLRGLGDAVFFAPVPLLRGLLAPRCLRAPLALCAFRHGTAPASAPSGADATQRGWPKPFKATAQNTARPDRPAITA